MDEEFESQDTEKYLVYQLGEEIFASPLMEVREVMEYRAAKPIPHTAAFFKGVLNIRGEIVGVVDLRIRLGVKSAAAPTAQLIFDCETGPLAAVVDRVHAVSIIAEKDMDRNPGVSAPNADRSYFLGVGRVEDQLVTVISLRKILNKDQAVDLPP